MIFRPLEIVGYIGWLLLNRVLQHVNRLPAGVDSPDFGEVVRALIAISMVVMVWMLMLSAHGSEIFTAVPLPSF